MKSFVVLFVVFGTVNSWLFSGWFKGSEKAEWSKLYVTFPLFKKLPTDMENAVKQGWRLERSCDASNYFAGNRYVLKGDTAIMLLFGANGQVAGMQMGIPKSTLKTNQGPWVLEGNMYVMTAYFTDPSTICSSTQKRSAYGDRLLIWDGSTKKAITIPFKEKYLTGTKWVKGKCFPWMGYHYWYAISQNMDCKAFYPVFLMYNGGNLNAFGWNTLGKLKSSRYEHPKSRQIGYFFKDGTKPKCLKTAGPITTQHIYMDWPHNNVCITGSK